MGKCGLFFSLKNTIAASVIQLLKIKLKAKDASPFNEMHREYAFLIVNNLR